MNSLPTPEEAFLEKMSEQRTREKLVAAKVGELIELRSVDAALYHRTMNQIKTAAWDGKDFDGFTAHELREIIIQCEGGLNYDLVKINPPDESEIVTRTRHKFNGSARRHGNNGLPDFHKVTWN